MRKHLIIVTIVAVALSAVLGYLSLNTNLIPYPASVERESIDNFVKILFAIASVFFAIIITVFVYALLFFRVRPGETGEGRPIKGYAPLERVWTLIPLVIVLVLAAFGGVVLNNMTKAGPPGSEMEVDVTAYRFAWQFSYPADNIISYELHVPVNQRLLVRLQSTDVVHSFWVQEWGPKQDAVPGMITEVRYTPTKIGQYLVECSQLCGYGHTYMTAPVFVTSLVDYQTWIQQQQRNSTPAISPSVSPSSPIPSPAYKSVVLNLIAQNMAFDTNNIKVTAGSQVTITFSNKDNGVPHNFAVYTDLSAVNLIFRGTLISGPGTITYTFTAPTVPGNYFFRCDVHPTTMTGTLVVQ